MENIKPQINQLLNTIPSVTVLYFYPGNWRSLPAISYYELNNSERTKADDEEYISDISIQIDIWTKNSEQTSDLALLVNEKMQSIEFHRTFAADLYETGTKIYHKTMRFEKIL